MTDILEAIQQFSQEERNLLKQKMAQTLNQARAACAPILEEALKKDEEYAKLGYIIYKGMKIKKNQRLFIPYTEEAWKEEMEKQKRYKAAKKDRENLANFIDKFFFEDGRSLHLDKHTASV